MHNSFPTQCRIKCNVMSCSTTKWLPKCCILPWNLKITHLIKTLWNTRVHHPLYIAPLVITLGRTSESQTFPPISMRNILILSFHLFACLYFSSNIHFVSYCITLLLFQYRAVFSFTSLSGNKPTDFSCVLGWSARIWYHFYLPIYAVIYVLTYVIRSLSGRGWMISMSSESPMLILSRSTTLSV